ncbi:TNT domain-containing protein [Desulfovibrio caledoniensis]
MDRYGPPTGNNLSPVGTPFEKRSLPAIIAKEYPIKYKVIKPLPVKEGLSEPWFGQPGKGTQFKTEMTVQELLDRKFIEEVD